MSLKRILSTLASLSLALTLATSEAVNFGGLNVTPRGAQNLNMETGATDMPGGGTATDSKSGLVLTATKMQLRPNETLSAQGATVMTRQGGTLTANSMLYDLKSGTVTASGNVQFSDSRVTALSAPKVVLYVKSGFVVASGGVKASKPVLNGAAFVFDPNTMQAVIGGPFTFQGGAVKSSGKAGERLLLTFAGNALTNATTRASADDLARFTPYLK